MSLERPHSRESSGSRGPPPPPPTYLWEEVRRSRSRGRYPWTILSKPPLPNHLDIEELLKGGVSVEGFFQDSCKESSNYGTSRREQIRNRVRDRERIGRARSEPTPSIPSISTTSLLSSGGAMDQAAAADYSLKSDELDDFHLANEDIPDFVMAYLQSDKGNLDENIPDHILEYIQSRAAALERDQQNARQHVDDEIVYTQDELRIINQARKRLEEQGELETSSPMMPDNYEEDVDAFDRYFQRTTADNQVAETKREESQQLKEPEPTESASPVKTSKKSGGKFNFKNLNVPNAAQLNLKLPKFGFDKKNKSKSNADHEEMETGDERKQSKPRRTQSASPMRQKFDQHLKNWNEGLKKMKTRSGRAKDREIKSFVALLPGRSGKKVPKKEIENQYDEVGQPRMSPDQTIPINSDVQRNDEAEETLENIEPLSESEVADGIRRDADAGDTIIVARGEFVDIDIDEDFEEDEEEVPDPVDGSNVETNSNAVQKSKDEEVGFAARSKKAFEMTKTKIQSSLSKNQLQATRNKLKSTLSKENMESTRKKVQSTLSKHNLQATRNKLQSTLTKENLQATRDKIQSSLTNTLNKKKKSNKSQQESIQRENIFPAYLHDDERQYETSTPIDRPYETSTPVERKTQDRRGTTDDEFPHSTTPPAVKQRKNKKTAQSNDIKPNKEGDIQEETEEELEEELEPKLEFSILGKERQRPSSVSQSTETLPEESDKENVIVRPKRQRYRHRRHGFHEELGRPHSVHSEPTTIRSSWVDKSESGYQTLDQAMLASFSAPLNSLDAINGSWGSPRRPDKPARSRSQKKLSATSTSQHLYSNVPPRRKKSSQIRTVDESINDNNMKTWPRENHMSNGEMPKAPRRYGKSKHSNKPVFQVYSSSHQTWPRRSLGLSPPTAPKRARSKLRLRELEEQITVGPIGNILIDADTLFGAESRFIDEEVDIQQPANHYNISNEPTANTDDDEGKILNTSNGLVEEEAVPVVPTRTNQRASTTRRIKRTAPSNGEMTWPRMSREGGPSVPQRRRKSNAKNQEKSDQQLNMEKPVKKLPSVPASTPCDEDTHVANSHPADMSSASSVQAGLDQILEILASTFPQESTDSNRNEEQANDQALPAATDTSSIPEQTSNADKVQEDIDENPYAEIKQFQRSPPPRPPPPIYVATTGASSSSYSYIYTVPRRKRGISSSVSPERPPRTYCTIRPHRPPRRSRSNTQEVNFIRKSMPMSSSSQADPSDASNRRHSLSAVDDSKEERNNLQSAPVIERMRARPLPAPPRSKLHRSRSPPTKPLRSRTSSTNKRQKADEDVVSQQQQSPKEPETPVETREETKTTDEYEPIENPATQVEEISIGIQTDPLPEFDDSSVMPEDNQGIEINNNQYHPPEVNPPRVDEPLVVEQPIEETTESVNSPTVVWSAANSPDPDDIIDSTVKSSEGHSEKKEDVDETVQSKKKDDDESDFQMRHHPSSFYRSIESLPPIRLDLPSRLQLSELEVDRLSVREVMAERLIVSSVDTNTFNVCQTVTSNASGQLLFNIPPGMTIAPLLPVAHREEADTTPSSQTEEQLPTSPEIQPTIVASQSDQNLSQNIQPAVDNQLAVNNQPAVDNQPKIESVPSQTAAAEPTFTNLACQLASLSTQHLINGACTVAAETYTIAQRVAEIGLRQLNEQLERRGIHYDDKEKEDLKAVLLMLLIVVCAIFLLGMGRQRISTHWDFYFPN